MITDVQIALMGANPANAGVPFVAPEKPWKPWHSPVMVLAGTDGEGKPWLYLAARCGWSQGYDSQHSPGVLARYAAMHIDHCDICKKDAPPDPARLFLLDEPATYDLRCPDCDEILCISGGHLYPRGSGTGIPLGHDATLGDLIDAASAHKCDEGEEQADG